MCMEIVFLFEHPSGSQLHTNTVILNMVFQIVVLSSWRICLPVPNNILFDMIMSQISCDITLSIYISWEGTVFVFFIIH